MSPEDDKIEDDELPLEIDRGLGLAFGGARSASPGPSVESKPDAKGSVEGGDIAAEHLTPGTVLLERYRIVGMLGRGGMGQVYRADDLILGQPVALKFLNERMVHDVEVRQRLVDEVRLAREIIHPLVCRVFDVCSSGDQMFLSMEYIDGEDLSSLLSRVGRLPAEKTIEVARQLCAALGAVHECGLVHRDLKPANVMLDGRGKVRLADFGLTAVLEDGKDKGFIVGTPGYMAPELLTGGSPSVQSDIYALGLVLYEVVTGKRAFPFNDWAGVLEAQRQDAVRPPSSVVANLDPRIEQVIDQCLASDLARRPSSALAVLAALPGGDPVAEALARGETPSPAAVVASGGVGDLRPWVVGSLLAVIMAGFFVLCWAAPQTRLTGSVPLDFSPEVFEYKAQQMLDGPLRYTENYPDWDWNKVYTARGFDWGYGYRQWLQARERSGGVVQLPPAALTPPYGFSYRVSRSRIFSPDPNQFVSALTTGGSDRFEAQVVLNPDGRLRFYRAYFGNSTSHPSGYRFEDDVWTPPDPPDPAAVDAAALLRVAGFDPDSMTPIRPTFWPEVPVDFRLAWLGVPNAVQGASESELVRVEAAFKSGRLASFGIMDNRPPEGLPERQETSLEHVLRLVERVLGQGMVIGLLFVSVVIVIWNVRMRRGDRRGALRVAVLVVVVLMLRWLLRTRYVGSPDAQFWRLGEALGYAFFIGGLGFMLYLGLEPLMRRFWPRLLIGWTRALDGRLRDPMVARDLLVGLALGMLMSVIEPVSAVVATAVGEPPPRPFDDSIETLSFGWMALDQLLRVLPAAAINGLLGALMFTLMRLLCRRQWLALLLLFPIAALGFPMAGTFGAMPFDLAVNGLKCVVFAFAMLQFGILAGSVAVALYMWTSKAPLTMDFSSWHATPTILLAGLLTVLALFAARHVCGREAMPLSRSPDIRAS